MNRTFCADIDFVLSPKPKKESTTVLAEVSEYARTLGVHPYLIYVCTAYLSQFLDGPLRLESLRRRMYGKHTKRNSKLRSFHSYALP
jgi:hypothetical protein